MKTAVREEIIKDFAETRQSCLLAALSFLFGGCKEKRDFCYFLYGYKGPKIKICHNFFAISATDNKWRALLCHYLTCLRVIPPGILRCIQVMWCLTRRVVCSAEFVRITARLKSMFALLSGAVKLLRIANA
jgi:hypothetical protein